MRSEQAAATGPPPTTTHTSTGLFARNATGLVRGVTPKSAFIINFIAGHPAFSLATSFFIVFSLFPGGNFPLALLLVLPLVLGFAYSYGLLTQMIPRSGGDYMMVSRVIHPSVGLISSFCMTLAGLLGNAFSAFALITVGIGPGLAAVGLLAKDPSLVHAGAVVQSDKWYKLLAGVIMMAIASGMLLAGWRWTLRIQNTLFWLVTGSLVVGVLVALFTSPHAFAGDFNSFAQPYTHSKDSYHEIIRTATKAGVNVSPGFSVSATIPVVGFFATFSIFSYFSSYVGGELRQGSTMKTSNVMAGAGVACLVIFFICALIFLHTFGHNFMIASGSASGLGTALPTSATWFVLTGVAVGSPVFMAVITICAAVLFWPLICYVAFLQPTRMIFAYSFDGILPKGVTKLSRTNAPYVAVIITFLLSVAVLFWAINSTSFIQIIVYSTLVQLISMALVGLSAVVVPWRRPEMYRASSSNKTILGVPLVTIAGAIAFGACAFIWFVYFHYKAQFGLTNVGRDFRRDNRSCRHLLPCGEGD